MASNLTRFDPVREIARFDPFRNMEDFIRDFSLMPALRGMETGQVIRMDIAETDTAYTIKAEVPGVKKEDIKVAVDGNQVTISAETKEEKEEKSLNRLRSERYYGQQYRSFTLPQEVDDTKSQAKYHDGILEMTLPKRPGTGGKQITIQ
ncbi:MAG: Hsp20/alpha crystallin family protein [Oxalobacteraceae bacterium]|jgi:HSP20 family protein|nr:Hsp20/alpha crystallin family protein [Oxalobacteraceae bacterium]